MCDACDASSHARDQHNELRTPGESVAVAVMPLLAALQSQVVQSGRH
jgi:hypothetical protein